MFDVVNSDATPDVKKLRPIGRAHAFFRRLRISVRGQIIEDTDNYNRVCELFHILQAHASRENDSIEQFGYNKDTSELNSTTLLPGITNYQTIMFQPLLRNFPEN